MCSSDLWFLVRSICVEAARGFNAREKEDTCRLGNSRSTVATVPRRKKLYINLEYVLVQIGSAIGKAGSDCLHTEKDRRRSRIGKGLSKIFVAIFPSVVSDQK